jgi:hypothetical protein
MLVTLPSATGTGLLRHCTGGEFWVAWSPGSTVRVTLALADPLMPSLTV